VAAVERGEPTSTRITPDEPTTGTRYRTRPEGRVEKLLARAIPAREDDRVAMIEWFDTA
jgi:hypothetical protein